MKHPQTKYVSLGVAEVAYLFAAVHSEQVSGLILMTSEASPSTSPLGSVP